ncbi:PIR Superfamily Protein [Plasmodium ovale wallikeri]|uniref:PIR Superfamily Protein n=1 Tax=Plasmodium ovale wallikeri TaxID=864142 RepID=A0A1A9A5U8_PLAOA|nr:PIR Superfamily Protein [Plasmodium ovale wallikeri]SBT54055.1 PIR Superfamily Protein [Plasmodium ovale wallikeri]
MLIDNGLSIIYILGTKIFFKELSSYKPYEELNKDVIDCSDCDKCCKNEEKIQKSPQKFSEFCEKISKKLTKLSTILKEINKIRDRCSYINYWSYEDPWKIFSTNSKFSINYSVVSGFHNIMIRINSKNKLKKSPCYLDFYCGIDKWKECKDWKDWNVLHDYFINCDHINSNIASFGKDKYNMYYKYLCFIAEDKLLTTDLICSVKYDSLSKIAYVLECKHDERSGYYKIVRSTGTSSDKMTSSNVLYTFRIMTLVAISFLGTFTVFLFFYKFIPLGCCLDRTKKKNKKREKNNFNNEYIHESSEHEFESIPINDHKRRIHLAYQSDSDS